MKNNNNEKVIHNYLLLYYELYEILNYIKNVSNQNNIKIISIYNYENTIYLKFKENEILKEFLEMIKIKILRRYNVYINEITINENKIYIKNINKLL